MKKVVGFTISIALLCGFLGGSTAFKQARAESAEEIAAEIVLPCIKAESLQIRAKSSYLMDYGTKTVMHAENERERLPIASMCKIMTLLLSFEATDRGDLTFDEELCISEKAASMGGSQVFLEANAKYPVKELIKSIVVCSANDSCVAIAERLAGSEELFVEKMNAKAKELGATDTLFSNCTGLPKEPQYSCAKDVALMLKSLLSHKEYFEFGKVWMDKFNHPEGRYTEISNTNKLVRFYDGCDGGKTGYTNDAGFCLAGTAMRGDMRVISVVIGAESSANRFEDTRKMFDYAFANYTQKVVVEGSVPLEEKLSVSGGKKDAIAVVPERTARAFCKRGDNMDITIEKRFDKVKAPVNEGDKVGELVIYKEGIEADRVSILAHEGVQKANFFDYFKKIGKGWNKRS